MKPYDTTGDATPFVYGGGVVYVDDKGNATWTVWPFIEEDIPEPDTDDEGNAIYGDETSPVFQIDVPKDVFADLNWVDVADIASSVGSTKELKKLGRSKNVMERVRVLEDIAGYHGYQNLDAYASQMTLSEIEGKYGDDWEAARVAAGKRRGNPESKSSNPDKLHADLLRKRRTEARDGEIDTLRREIEAGAAGRTIVTDDWLRWARVELRRLMKQRRVEDARISARRGNPADASKILNPAEARMKIFTNKLYPSGALELATEYRGNRYHMRYDGYTAAEAKRRFREYVLEEDGKIVRERRENPADARLNATAARLARGES